MLQKGRDDLDGAKAANRQPNDTKARLKDSAWLRDEKRALSITRPRKR